MLHQNHFLTKKFSSLMKSIATARAARQNFFNMGGGRVLWMGGNKLAQMGGNRFRWGGRPG